MVMELIKEIWLISQFPAKHTGVASGAKIVFARPGLTLFSGYGHAVINNEVIIFIVCSPQSDCISLFWDPSVTFWPSRMVRSANKKSREKHRHFSLYVQNISGCREKKGAQNTKITWHFKFHLLRENTGRTAEYVQEWERK